MQQIYPFTSSFTSHWIFRLLYILHFKIKHVLIFLIFLFIINGTITIVPCKHVNVCFNCIVHCKIRSIAQRANIEILKGFSLSRSSKLWNLCSNRFKSCREGPRTTCWTSVADPKVRPLAAIFIMRANKESHPRESIKCVIRVYVEVIMALLMCMTCNEQLSTMNVKISWLHSCGAKKRRNRARNYWISIHAQGLLLEKIYISALTSNTCTVSIRSKKKKIGFYCSAQTRKCIKMSFSFISEEEYRQQCIWNMT